jgi:hypothetical protein
MAADGDGCKTCTVCIQAPHAEKMTLLRECPLGGILASASHRRKTRGRLLELEGLFDLPTVRVRAIRPDRERRLAACIS